MSERVNNARFQQIARGKFGIKGDNPVPTLRDVIPVAIIEDYRPEDFLVGGDDFLFATFFGAGAVALETYASVIWNPPDSGVLGIIEAIDGANTGATTGFFFYTVTDPALNGGLNRGSLLSRDTRMSSNGTITQLSGFALQFWTGTLTAAELALFPVSAMRFPTALFPHHPGEVYVIHEGFGLGYLSNVQNLAANAAYFGRQHLQPQGVRT